MTALPHNWRISKYDPTQRNSDGHYLAEDWTFFAQIGQFFNGKPLTYEDYVSVESAYVHSVLLFLFDAGLSALTLVELQKSDVAKKSNWQLQDIGLHPMTLPLGGIYDEKPLENVIRLSLRELIGCKLEVSQKFYIHFGWDYYMYIGSTSPSLKAIMVTRQNGLYVEPMISPYL